MYDVKTMTEEERTVEVIDLRERYAKCTKGHKFRVTQAGFSRIKRVHKDLHWNEFCSMALEAQGV